MREMEADQWGRHFPESAFRSWQFGDVLYGKVKFESWKLTVPEEKIFPLVWECESLLLLM